MRIDHVLVVLVLLGTLLIGSGSIAARSRVDFDRLSAQSDTLHQGNFANKSGISEGCYGVKYGFAINQTDAFNASFDTYGSFGHYYSSHGWSDVFKGFESPAFSGIEYLYGGAIWIGGIVGADTLVSVGHDGWNLVSEMRPPGYPRYPGYYPGNVEISYSTSGRSFRTDFSDTSTFDVPDDVYDNRPHMPLGIDIQNRSHVWNRPGIDHAVLYDVTINNIGGHYINDMFIGLPFDPDICHESIENYGLSDDLAGSIRSSAIAYGIDNDGDPQSGSFGLTSPIRAFACKILYSSGTPTDTNFNWWIAYDDTVHDYGPWSHAYPPPDPADRNWGYPKGDVQKYILLSNPSWDHDQVYTATIDSLDSVWRWPRHYIDSSYARNVSDGGDTKFMLSIGPYDLFPDSAIRLIFTTFTADTVHTNPNNLANLPSDPDIYVANLNLQGLLNVATVAEQYADSLLNPLNPVTGLRMTVNHDGEWVLSWDPWVLDNIQGYNVYLYEIPWDIYVPHPGVIPPWYDPPTMNLVATLDRHETKYILTDIDTTKWYFVNVAHRTSEGIGDAGRPLLTRARERFDGPSVPWAIFRQPGSNPTFTISDSSGRDIDHFNVYRFPSYNNAGAMFHYSFYDEGCASTQQTIIDSLFIEGAWWYYYELEPYVQVPASDSIFTDTSSVDSICYYVTAVDTYGFESSYSRVLSLIAPERTGDVLVLCKVGSPNDYVHPDTVRNRYAQILQTLGLTYNILFDDLEELDIDSLMKYRLTIVESGLADEFGYSNYHFWENYSTNAANFGKTALCGSFAGSGTGAPYTLSDTAMWWTGYFLPLGRWCDSIFYQGLMYCQPDFPCSDNLADFQLAESLYPDSFPDVAFDLVNRPYSLSLDTIWAGTSPPGVAAFKLRDIPVGLPNAYYANWHVEPLALYRSTSGSAIPEGYPVAFRADAPSFAPSYYYGFHLWYMDPANVASLIKWMLGDEGGDDADDESDLPFLVPFNLLQNYPNPFNPTTTIKYSLARATMVELTVYNILGQRVVRLIDGMKPAGSHYVNWDGTDSHGQKVASGIYFYRLDAGNHSSSKKMVLLK